MLGSSFTDNTVATGFGLHLAQPILRKEWREDLSVAEGKAILESCMKVLFYRDGRTINRVRYYATAENVWFQLTTVSYRFKSALSLLRVAKFRSRTRSKQNGAMPGSESRAVMRQARGDI